MDTLTTFKFATLVDYITVAVESIRNLRNGERIFPELTHQEEYELADDSLNALVAELHSRAVDTEIVREAGFIAFRALGDLVAYPFPAFLVEQAAKEVRQERLTVAFKAAGDAGSPF